VGNVERGRWVPRPEAHWKLEQALGLEADAAIRLRRVAGIDADLLRAPAIPNLSIWKHLPESLFTAAHTNLALWEAGFDDLLTELVPSMASLLACASLAKKPPTRSQLERLKNAARACFERSLEHHRQYPQWSPIGDVAPAASSAASILPRAWRTELFAERRSSERAVKLLKRWAYSPPGYWHRDDRPRFTVQFRDAALDRVYRFTEVPPELIGNTHDAMTARRLRHDLNLAAELGVEVESRQEWDLRSDVTIDDDARTLVRLPYGLGDVLHELRTATDRAKAETDYAKTASRDAHWQAVQDLLHARQRAKFTLRLFELPDLADKALSCSKDELLAALAAAAEVVHDPDRRH